MNKIESDLKGIFQNIFKIPKKKIDIKTNFKNLRKQDTLNHVKLIMAIESKFKISIDPDQSIEMLSYKSILNYLVKKIK